VKTIDRLAVFLVVIVCFCGKSFGDGKVYVGEKVPPNIPYQRAFLIFHENQETLILQSKYEFPQSTVVDSLGWIVPMPSVPDISSVNADIAKYFFLNASWIAKPEVYHVSSQTFILSFVIFVGSIAFWGFCIIQRPFLNMWKLSKESWNRRFRICSIVLIVSFIISFLSMPTLGKDGGVEVVKAEKAGIYDVRVIRSESVESILDWLKQNGFIFNENDTNVFQDYIQQKWCFVVAKVRPEIGTREQEIVYRRMVAPLILKFNAEKAIYPLALTATTNKKTEILLYTLSDNKLDCNKRLKLRVACNCETDKFMLSPARIVEQDIINLFKDMPKSMFLCKFKSTLTPEQMKTDIVFENAPDNEPYRETKIVW
jgi:hypothetical protein